MASALSAIRSRVKMAPIFHTLFPPGIHVCGNLHTTFLFPVAGQRDAPHSASRLTAMPHPASKRLRCPDHPVPSRNPGTPAGFSRAPAFFQPSGHTPSGHLFAATKISLRNMAAWEYQQSSRASRVGIGVSILTERINGSSLMLTGSSYDVLHQHRNRYNKKGDKDQPREKKVPEFSALKIANPVGIRLYAEKG